MSDLGLSERSGNGIGQFRSKSSWAYQTVRGMIMSGDLAAGTSIDQQALATRLGISTTPLREALRRLEAEGYVLAQHHKESRLAPPATDARARRPVGSVRPLPRRTTTERPHEGAVET